MVKDLPAGAGDTGSIPGSGRAWRSKWQSTPVSLLGEIPWKEEPGSLWSMGS